VNKNKENNKNNRSTEEIIANIIEKTSNRGNKRNRDANVKHCQKIEEIVRRHLHLPATLNSIITKIEPGDTWHSSDKDNIKLGATYGTRIDFMTNNNTWIMDNKGADYINEAVKALENNPHNRIAGLLDNNSILKDEICKHKGNKKVQINTIIGFAPGTLMTEETNNEHPYRDPKDNRNKNYTSIDLIEICTPDSMRVDRNEMIEEIKNCKLDRIVHNENIKKEKNKHHTES